MPKGDLKNLTIQEYQDDVDSLMTNFSRELNKFIDKYPIKRVSISEGNVLKSEMGLIAVITPEIKFEF
jgi:hypothetical protein